MGRPVFALVLALGAVAAVVTSGGAAGALASGAAATSGSGAAAAATPAPAPPSPAAPEAAGSGSPGSAHQPALRVLSQTPWVGPGQAMQLRLGVGNAPRPSLTLSVTVYSCLTSRSAFAETVNGTAAGFAEGSTTIPVSSLPADPQGGVVLTVPVDSGQGGTAAGGNGPSGSSFVAPLHCTSGPGGVYPLRLQLSSDSGGRSSLFTYIVYAAPPPTTQKLRVAWVVPLALSSTAAGADGRAPTPRTSDLEQLSALLGGLGAHNTVPVTLAPEPAALVELAASTRPRAHSALTTLATLAGQPGHQVLDGSYVPVDATALVNAGLQGELAAQVHRAAQVLGPLHGTSGTWLAEGPVDAGSLSALAQLGYSRVVVPASDVLQSGTQALTPSQPFLLQAGHGLAPQTVEFDGELETHLGGAAGADPALAAYQFLADLALVYYEQPNLDTARGVVAVPPAGAFAADPVFLDTVLSSLPVDPLVTPVTLDTLFGSVPTSTSTSHRPAGASTSGSALPAHQIRDVRSRVTAFGQSVASTAAGTAVARQIEGLLLSAEDVGLRPSQQQQGVAGAGAAIDAQLALLAVRNDSIHLTSTAAKIPITLVKAAPYTVEGVLKVTGDKVEFPAGTAQVPGPVCRDAAVRASAGRSVFTCTATVSRATDAVYIDMLARATGDFRLSVTFSSRDGHLLLASSHLTVRSLSTSLVAIGLSGAAVLVLLWWWGRTLLRRHPVRGAHVRRSS
ncbi:MAG TPA: hypothetical protein VE991_00955 [Acidimicrobiales bacterium]|nr:hypothetical protein [Acidimicrobiales bacterium]